MARGKISEQGIKNIQEGVGACHRGKPKSEEQRAKMSAAASGKPKSEECKRKMSIVRRKKRGPQSPVTVKGIEYHNKSCAMRALGLNWSQLDKILKGEDKINYINVIKNDVLQVIKRIAVNGDWIMYEYYDNGLIKREIHHDGYTKYWEYDDLGREVLIEDNAGNRSIKEYSISSSLRFWEEGREFNRSLWEKI